MRLERDEVGGVAADPVELEQIEDPLGLPAAMADDEKIVVGFATAASGFMQAYDKPAQDAAMIAIDERDLRELAVGSGGFDGGGIARAQPANEAVMVHCAASPAAATSSKAAS